MSEQRTDRTGATVSIALDETRTVSAYTVSLEDGTLAGRADYTDPQGSEGERIFFHTEVAEEFGGRGLAGLLVREALADSIRKDLTVVPVCPLFAKHLEKHGDDFTGDGGRFRKPRPADLAAAEQAMKGQA